MAREERRRAAHFATGEDSRIRGELEAWSTARNPLSPGLGPVVCLAPHFKDAVGVDNRCPFCFSSPPVNPENARAPSHKPRGTPQPHRRRFCTGCRLETYKAKLGVTVQSPPDRGPGPTGAIGAGAGPDSAIGPQPPILWLNAGSP